MTTTIQAPRNALHDGTRSILNALGHTAIEETDGPFDFLSFDVKRQQCAVVLVCNRKDVFGKLVEIFGDDGIRELCKAEIQVLIVSWEPATTKPEIYRIESKDFR